MRRTRLLFLALSVLGLSVSCGGSAIDQGDDGDDGSAAATGGSKVDNETAVSGGAASGGADHGTGGTRPQGTATGGMGMGGEGPVEEKPRAIPSTACSLPGAVPEDMKLELSIDSGVLLVSLPSGYDGAVPGPIIIAFPGTEDRLDDLVRVDELHPNPLLDDYVIARAKAGYSEYYSWEGTTEEDYDTLYRELASQVCFDEARVLGVGNASGGRFLVEMMSKPAVQGVVRPPDFLAMAVVGPVANRAAPWPNVPLLFIHSTTDLIDWGDHDGKLDAEKRRLSKDCSDMSVPAGTTTYFGDVTYACEDFTGCTSPFRFCSHDKPTQIDEWETNHNIELHRFFADYL